MLVNIPTEAHSMTIGLLISRAAGGLRLINEAHAIKRWACMLTPDSE